jgi:hypothetical protein
MFKKVINLKWLKRKNKNFENKNVGNKKSIFNFFFLIVKAFQELVNGLMAGNAQSNFGDVLIK